MGTLSTAGRNAAATGILGVIDAATDADIRFLDGATLLVTCACSNPSFTGPSTGVLTLDTSPAVSGVAVAAGTADGYQVTDGRDAVVSGTAGDAGTEEIVLDESDIGIGDTVTVTGLTITVVASP